MKPSPTVYNRPLMSDVHSSAAVCSLLIVAAYVIGAIPFGLIVGKMRGIDVRTAGSGNIGATNVGRLLGRKFFFAVFVLDMLKGLVPMALASVMIRHLPPDAAMFLQILAVGFAAIVGHMFSVFLQFKGGKGVSTSAGVLLGLWPYFTLPGVVVILIFSVLLKTTRYMSIASMIGSLCFPLAYLVFAAAFHWPVIGAQWPLLLFAVVVPVMIVWKHRSNIGRLVAGTEKKLGSSKATAEDAATSV